MRSLFTILLGLGLMLSVAGCDSNSLEKGPIRLRVIHAATDAGSLDFYIDFNVFSQGLSFREASPYIQWKPGLRMLDVRYRVDGIEQSVTREVLLDEDHSYTILLTGLSGPSAIVVLDDDRIGAIPGNARLSVAHGATTIAPTNVLITEEDGTPVVDYTNLVYGTAMPYTHIGTGTYDFLVNATDGQGGIELKAFPIEDSRRYLLIVTNSVLFAVVEG